MKRRNVDCAKPRRMLKRSKIGEGFYGSGFVYVKLFLIWVVVVCCDFLFEFRFEYLWPFWLLLRSFHDSFRYQGVGFSVLFFCMTVTSDMICFLFIPVNWLFFAASTYVWVQFVWHSEKGVCMPAIILWVIFIYVELLIRLKDIKTAFFHLDLCRPFAAHCIGYPVVTLGFGIKSYVGYRIRQRKQREVTKENSFYYNILNEALPIELRTTAEKSLKDSEDLANGDLEVPHNNSVLSNNPKSICNGVSTQNSSHSLRGRSSKSGMGSGNSDINSHSKDDMSPASKVSNNKLPNGSLQFEIEYMQKKGWSSSKSVNEFDENDSDRDKTNFKQNNSYPTSPNFSPGSEDKNKKNGGSISNAANSSIQANGSVKFGTHQNNFKENSNLNFKENSVAPKKNKIKEQVIKDDSVTIIRLECDLKRLRVDLDSSRQNENELRNQLNSRIVQEKNTRDELNQLQRDNDNLQNKLHNLVTARQSDKASLSALEKKFHEEKKSRQSAENSVNSLEKRNKKLDEQSQARAQALATAKSGCSESCRIRKESVDSEIKRLRRDLRTAEDRFRNMERENQSLRQHNENHNEAQVLMNALNSMKLKTSQLEASLSAETKIKLDLFSALGEAKRQLSISRSQVSAKERDMEDLKTKFTEVLAVCSPPTNSMNSFNPPSSAESTSRYHSSKLLPQISSAELSMNSVSELDYRMASTTELSSLVDCSTPLNLGVDGPTPLNLGMDGSTPLNLGVDGLLDHNLDLSLMIPGFNRGSNTPMASPAGSQLSNLDPNALAYTPNKRET